MLPFEKTGNKPLPVAPEAKEEPANGGAVSVASRPVITRFNGAMTSLGAGGVALVTRQNISREVWLRIPLILPGGPQVEVTASIVTVDPLSGGQYVIRAMFVEIDEETRDAIAQYVLHQQEK